MPTIRPRLANVISNPDHVLSHWLWALPVLLIVAALGLRQIDLYPPDTDEFYSMYSAGWLVGGPFSPLDIIEYLNPCCTTHVPGYFFLLSAWGNLISYEVAVGRIFSVFCYLLALAVVYRLGRDFVAPGAGFFVLVILASNAYANFYVAHLRMYPLLMMTASIVFWLYLRIVESVGARGRGDYVALAVAAIAFLSVHLFSIVFLLPLAAYHLLFARRGRRWLMATLTGATVFILSAPWLVVVIQRTVETASDESDFLAFSDTAWGILSTLLSLVANGQGLLLLLCLVGLAVAAKAKRRLPKPVVLIAVFHIVVIIVLNEASSFIIRTSGLRYLLPTFIPLSLLAAAGLYHLFRFRRESVILLVLWLAAGTSFHNTTEWRPHIAGRELAFRLPPWQVIARLAPEPPPLVLGDFNMSNTSFSFNRRIPYSQQLHFFGPKDIPLIAFDDVPELHTIASQRAVTQPHVWLVYDLSNSSADEIDGMLSAMSLLDYVLCETTPIGAHWAILDYYWDNLDCALREPISEPRTAITSQKFYDARLSQDGSQLSFVDSWSAPADIESDYFAMSYQLLSEDWDNAAQLDLPLVHEGLTRRFSIETRDLPPGAYRLMLILYDRRTGKPLDWIDNPGYAPSLMELSEVVIPD